MTFKTHDIWEYFTGRPYHFTSTNENKLRSRVRLAGSEVPDFLGELAEKTGAKNAAKTIADMIVEMEAEKTAAAVAERTVENVTGKVTKMSDSEGADIVLKTDGLTKNYGEGRGIFGISLEVKRGDSVTNAADLQEGFAAVTCRADGWFEY